MDPLLGQPACQLRCPQPGREPRQNPLPVRAAVPFEAVDVDLDPQLLARFDLEVPVLIHHGAGGERVLPRFSPRLGASQLAAWLTQQGVH